MAKPASQYVCQHCGETYRKWVGQCTSCGTWDSVVEEVGAGASFSRLAADAGSNVIAFESLAGELGSVARKSTSMEEMDRVLGGGLVPGSAVLIGGDPGIGKSTLLLQMVANLANAGASCAYVTGEESIDQVKLRARRLGLAGASVQLAAATNVKDIIASFKRKAVQDSMSGAGNSKSNVPDIIVIDSIQTMYVDSVSSAPGTVTQVRSSAYELISFAKASGAALLIVGHVTKDGQIAGPKVLEHMVDTVLYFEGERGEPFHILRAVKNRYGGANEIGVFEMTDKGLMEVPNPSSLFISGKAGEVSGSCVFAGIEGTRPMLVEIQALVSPSSMATPRRAVVGWDINRLAMILAVLSSRGGFKLVDKEVYLNVVGGLKIAEPAADLAVAASLVSALSGVPLAGKAIFIGEIGLSGEIRPVSRMDVRLKEAEKLGFHEAVVPVGTMYKSKDFILREITYISQLKTIGIRG